MEKKHSVYGFYGLEKAYDRVNRGALWQVLRKYDVGGKLLNSIKSMYVNSQACVGVKGGESECFRIDNGVFHVPLPLQCIYGPEAENGDGEDGSEISEGGKRVEITWPLVCR